MMATRDCATLTYGLLELGQLRRERGGDGQREREHEGVAHQRTPGAGGWFVGIFTDCAGCPLTTVRLAPDLVLRAAVAAPANDRRGCVQDHDCARGDP